jgi:hypothetical protein
MEIRLRESDRGPAEEVRSVTFVSAFVEIHAKRLRLLLISERLERDNLYTPPALTFLT